MFKTWWEPLITSILHGEKTEKEINHHLAKLRRNGQEYYAIFFDSQWPIAFLRHCVVFLQLAIYLPTTSVVRVMRSVHRVGVCVCSCDTIHLDYYARAYNRGDNLFCSYFEVMRPTWCRPFIAVNIYKWRDWKGRGKPKAKRIFSKKRKDTTYISTLLEPSNVYR